MDYHFYPIDVAYLLGLSYCAACPLQSYPKGMNAISGRKVKIETVGFVMPNTMEQCCEGELVLIPHPAPKKHCMKRYL